MRPCRFCGTSVEDDTVICPNCGKAIPAERKPSSVPAEQAEKEPEKKQTAPQNEELEEIEVLSFNLPPVNEPVRQEMAPTVSSGASSSHTGLIALALVALFIFMIIPKSGGSSGKSSSSSSGSKSRSSSSSTLGPGEYWCMGKNDTCKNKTYSAYDFYCDSCDPDGDNIEGVSKSTSSSSSGKKSSSGSKSSSSGSSSELGPGEYWCMGKNDTCKNKTYSPYDFYCSSCDPDGDNIEG